MIKSAQDTILYQTDDYAVGLFDCPTETQDFHDSGPAGGNLIVFPRYSVQITHANKPAIIADQNNIIFYNQGQEYTRDAVSRYGDYSLFFNLNQPLLLQILAEICPTSIASENTPLSFINCLCSPKVYLAQYQLTCYLQSAQIVDPILVETQIMDLLHHSLNMACRHWYPKGVRQKHPSKSHRLLVEDAKKLLNLRNDFKITLIQLASQLATTPFHLCRVFHKVSGISLNKYINRLRLHSSLDQVSLCRKNMTHIGLDLGFANPSHFAMAFKKHFSMTPSAFRNSV